MLEKSRKKRKGARERDWKSEREADRLTNACDETFARLFEANDIANDNGANNFLFISATHNEV